MKTKLIALMLAFVCLCGALAGCSKDKCAHKDENKDMKCDSIIWERVDYQNNRSECRKIETKFLRNCAIVGL